MATPTLNPAANPANAREVTSVAEPARIPMNTPNQRLQTVEIPGYKTHWMRGTPERIQQALAAGYTFVTDEEVKLNYRGFADSASVGGNTDLGSHVSISAGRSDDRGNPIRLVLMKLPKKFEEADNAAHAAQQEAIAKALREGTTGIEKTSGEDRSKIYTGSQNRNIFNRRA